VGTIPKFSDVNTFALVFGFQPGRRLPDFAPAADSLQQNHAPRLAERARRHPVEVHAG
jgi:hypothetical protein